MKRTTTWLGSVILLVSMLVLGVGPTSWAQSGCSLASLHGAYGVLLNGFSQFGNSVASSPSTTLGMITADGAGNISLTSFSASHNGTIVQFPTATGTYTVNPDCTGTFFTGGGATANFMIVARGSQVLAISTVPGSVESGIAIKQDLSGCSLSSLQGIYGVHQTGFFQAAGTTVASLPSAAVGTFIADGVGGLSATVTSSQNGTIQLSQTFTATYTVNPDCTGTFSSASGNASFVIVARGSQVLFISTFPGEVGAGVAFLSPSALQISALSTIDVQGSVETDAVGISNPGNIVGFFTVSGDTDHGFLLAGGLVSTVDVPGSSSTDVLGVNDRSQMVGVYGDSTGRSHGFLLSGGSFTTINFPGAATTHAYGINNPGAIVGRYRDTSGFKHGFLFAGGNFSTIDFPGSTETRAFGINDVGQVVGRFRDSLGQFHGFLLSNGSFSVVHFPGATFTSARGINNQGTIVGFYTDAGGITHGFLLSGGTFRTVDVPGAIETDLLGINDVGQIVGSYADFSGKFHGFLAHR